MCQLIKPPQQPMGHNLHLIHDESTEKLNNATRVPQDI